MIKGFINTLSSLGPRSGNRGSRINKETTLITAGSRVHARNGSKIGARAFTLIELLVVVLIIGILSAIALPQYTTAVEKSRVAEVLTNISAMKQQIDLYLLQNGRPASGQSVSYKEFTSVDLSGGSWDGNIYSTANFSYQPQITHPDATIVIKRLPNQYQLWISDGYHAWMAPEYDVDSVIGKWMPPTCVTQKTVIGRKICKQLQSQGYQYLDEEFS